MDVSFWMLFLYITLCVYCVTCTQHSTRVEVRGQFGGLSSLHHVALGDRTQAVRLGGKDLYPRAQTRFQDESDLYVHCKKSLERALFCVIYAHLFSQVSTAEQCRSSPKSMISCNKKSLYLPQEMSAVYIEFTEYYYPDGKDFPSKRVYFVVVCLLLNFLEENLGFY